MGHHNLPRSYDAWRLSSPWDDEPTRTGTVSASLFIEAGEMTIDAEGEYDADTGELVTVWVNGTSHPVHEVAAMLAIFAPRQTGVWDRDMDPDELHERIQSAAEADACDRADYQRDRDLDH